MTCPICGGDLVTISGPPEWAPYQCEPCARGWFTAEIDTVAAAPELFDPQVGFLPDAFPALGADLDQELAAAAERGDCNPEAT